MLHYNAVLNWAYTALFEVNVRRLRDVENFSLTSGVRAASMRHPGAYAHGGIADHGMGGAVECEVLAALDREGEQEREGDSERRGYPKERPRGARREQAEDDRGDREKGVEERHHGDHAGIGWDDARQEGGDRPACADDGGYGDERCARLRSWGLLNENRPHSATRGGNGGDDADKWA